MRGDTGDVNRRLNMKILVNITRVLAKKRLITWATPYVKYDPTEVYNGIKIPSRIINNDSPSAQYSYMFVYPDGS